VRDIHNDFRRETFSGSEPSQQPFVADAMEVINQPIAFKISVIFASRGGYTTLVQQLQSGEKRLNEQPVSDTNQPFIPAGCFIPNAIDDSNESANAFAEKHPCGHRPWY